MQGPQRAKKHADGVGVDVLCAAPSARGSPQYSPKSPHISASSTLASGEYGPERLAEGQDAAGHQSAQPGESRPEDDAASVSQRFPLEGDGVAAKDNQDVPGYGEDEAGANDPRAADTNGSGNDEATAAAIGSSESGRGWPKSSKPEIPAQRPASTQRPTSDKVITRSQARQRGFDAEAPRIIQTRSKTGAGKKRKTAEEVGVTVSERSRR